ncbi:MAG: hypothetical protein ACRCT8_01235 [Lacipirellulaceae bacterium]
MANDYAYPAAQVAAHAPAASRTDWTALGVAIVAPILIVHFCVVQPTTLQLRGMRDQVAQLEATVLELRGKAPAAAAAAGLLGALADQQGVIEGAESALERLALVEQRLAEGVARAEHAAKTLDRLDDLRDRIALQGNQLGQASAALATLAGVPNDLQQAIDQASRVAPSVAQVRGLRDRLADAQEVSAETLGRIDALLVTQQGLVRGAEDLESATVTLEGLAKLEERLNAPLMAVTASHERLDELMRLKDQVIAQTQDLPAAFETLEMMAQLGRDYRQASAVFRSVERLLADLVLLEPSINRIASVVNPLVERSSLSKLGSAELRLVMQELHRRHVEAVEAADDTAIATREGAGAK